MTEFTAYFNGEWVPDSQVRIEPTDRGFQVADVVFDVARTFDGKSFRMKEHVDRLYRSLKYVRIDAGLSEQEMIDVSEETIRRNEHLRPEGGDFTITQFVTRGKGRAYDAGPPTVCVRVYPVDFSRYKDGYENGMHGVITRTRSYSPESLDPKVKHYSRMNFTLAELEANDADPGAWAILTDNEGNLTEGIGYNVLLVTDGVIRSPGDRAILQGVSRGMVFDLARQLDIPGRGGGPAALRPVHGGRGLLHEHEPVRAASDGGRPPPDRRRQAGAGHSAASRRVERGRGSGRGRPGAAVCPQVTAQIPANG